MRQFLIESVLLSLVGGFIGIVGGLTLSWAVTAVLNSMSKSDSWPLIISTWSILVSLGFSAAVGMIFGLYPAYQASRLDPIDALRYE
ncbi:MAG: FtsX-like permease family protein [Pirellulales bacterium]